MHPEEKFQRFLAQYPHGHQPFYNRPHSTRRRFLEILGAGVTASFLAGRLPAADLVTTTPVKTLNKARNVVFILLAGAPSGVDTFDFKETPDSPLDRLKGETVNGLRWPTGALPKLAANLPDLAIVRSMRSWALQHSLAQTWAQIGRSPAAALGDIAPNIGSIVSVEKESERKLTEVFPTFLALNSNGAIGAGYLSSRYAPFKLTPSAAGLPNTSNADGQTRFEDKWSMLHQLDDPLRLNSPLGRGPQNYEEFYQDAKGLMYNPVADAFRFTSTDSQRYGTSGFGNACLVARQVLAANQGTRFIQITLGGWDMHTDIYGAGQNARGNNIFSLGATLDNGLSALLGDLKSSGLLNETLVVMMGEFGRTVGRLSAQAGRDHYLQQFAVFAGAGVKGGRAIGSTKPDGSATEEYGWSRGRDIRDEDVEATIYSALGINWTSVRYDDPFGRGFEYVPGASKEDAYGPIDELWA